MNKDLKNMILILIAAVAVMGVCLILPHLL